MLLSEALLGHLGSSLLVPRAQILVIPPKGKQVPKVVCGAPWRQGLQWPEALHPAKGYRAGEVQFRRCSSPGVPLQTALGTGRELGCGQKCEG